MKYHSKENATFRGGEPTWANACVGENGNPQKIEYARGFAAAANVLLDVVIKNRGLNFHIDVFIYPICFNMRHAVELFLKDSVIPLTDIAHKRGAKTPEFDVTASHDLGKIWKHVQQVAPLADKRYDAVITALEEYVSDIATVDATGQVFRYPYDTENKKHLTDLAVINAAVLKTRFNALEDLLRQFDRLNGKLLEEYECGSFTTRLSRLQLLELATKLHQRNKWAEPDFDINKAHLQKEYGLSSNDICRALNIIQRRHEMASLIGATVAIPELDLQCLLVFFDIWSKMHDIEKLRIPPLLIKDDHEFVVDSLSGMEEWYLTSQQCSDDLTAAVSPNCFASLRALYYFQYESPYSEMFDRLLNQYSQKAARHLTNPDDYKNDAFQFLSKVGALENILNSLNFLGQSELVNSVLGHYDLLLCRERILAKIEAQKMRLIEFPRVL